MKHNRDLLLRVLRSPELVVLLALDEWDLLIRQARSAGLLARLAVVLQSVGLNDKVPSLPARHLGSASISYEAQQRAVNWEVTQIKTALKNIDIPIILLKGAAYSIAELDVGQGRMFNDIDIMVPKAALDVVERSMRAHGWFSSHKDDYDERYYRKWMHELPPLRHIKRQTVIDVHHAILPETARLHPDSEKLMADAIAIEGKENIFVLAPVDMILHSATHLFHDGELEHGLRDLIDLDGLLRHFGGDAQFWDNLAERAAEIQLGRPLYYALRFAHEFLDTPIPDATLKAAKALGKPSVISPLMDALFRSAIMPDHASCDTWFTPIARWMLYVRSHYLRMPLHLLIPHLLRKALKRKKQTLTIQNRAVENQ